MPLAHISLPVTDLAASKAFYLTILQPLGYGIYKEFEQVVGLGLKRGAPDLWLHKCPDEKPPATLQKTHVAFTASSRQAVHAFYEAAMGVGAVDNGPPGERPQYIKGYYAAYVLDPDGNNIECLYFQPLWLTAIQSLPIVVGILAVAGAWWAGKQGWATV